MPRLIRSKFGCGTATLEVVQNEGVIEFTGKVGSFSFDHVVHKLSNDWLNCFLVLSDYRSI